MPTSKSFARQVFAVLVGLIPTLITMPSMRSDAHLAPPPIVVAGTNERRIQSAGGLEWVVEIQPPTGMTSVSPDLVAAMQTALQRRGELLGLARVQVQAIGTSQLRIRAMNLPFDPGQIEAWWFKPWQVRFRQQRQGTEAKLSAALAEQRTLRDQVATDRSLRRDPAYQKAVQQNQQEILRYFDPTPLNGTFIRRVQVDNSGGFNSITLGFDDRGAPLIAKLTKELAGTNRRLGIFVNDDLVSSPTVGREYASAGITGGTVTIAGSFETIQSNELAMQFRMGSMPLPTTIDLLSVNVFLIPQWEPLHREMRLQNTVAR